MAASMSRLSFDALGDELDVERTAIRDRAKRLVSPLSTSSGG